MFASKAGPNKDDSFHLLLFAFPSMHQIGQYGAWWSKSTVVPKARTMASKVVLALPEWMVLQGITVTECVLSRGRGALKQGNSLP